MEISNIPIEPVSDHEIILWARKESAVEELLKLDPKTEIFIRRLEPNDVNQIHKSYPDLLSPSQESIIVVNIISSQMLSNQGYKKIRLYYNSKGIILNRLETN